MFMEWADLKWIARCLGCSLDGLPDLKMLLLLEGFTISMFSLRCRIAELEYFMLPRAAAVPGLFCLI